MKVGGFGNVPASWDESSKTYQWQVNRPLRLPACEVNVSWKGSSGSDAQEPLRWAFRIDHEAAYIPQLDSTP